MRKLLTMITVLLLLVNSFSFCAEAAEQLPDSNHFPQTPSAVVTQGNSIGSAILVGLHLGAAATDLDTTLSSVDVQSVEPLFPDAPIETVLSRIFRLRLASTSDVPSTLARLMVHPSVDYAEVDQVAHTVTTTPNDPLLPGQWALPQISAPAAWDVITGTPTAVIAMLDTGIDVDHPDLVGRLWSNPGETPNNGIDDDTNGYIDDVHGWNFIAQTNEVDDDDGHGTKVAGVAVAETNNGVGVAGVCWNCRIMVVKVVQPGGFANYSDIALGVYYAVSKGADVINISLGGAADSATLRAAVEAATETAVVVAAVGDGNTSTQFYPAAYPDVLAVGGTTAADTRASFSNYGQWVDVAAPAVMITTTLNGGNYGPASGTSMAAPFVSGLAGLVSSQHPDWTPSLVQSQIVHTTDAIAATGLGSGRINAAAAVTQIPRPLLTIASTAINGDALGRPTPGEGASLMMNLKNDWLDATAVTGVLSTTDPYVTITNNTAAFGDIPAGETGPGGSVYSFTVASGAGYNYPIPFTLQLSANSGAYTTTLPLTITTRSTDQIVGGTIVTHTVWTSDKTYIVSNNVGVAPGITLTIQPGTVVRFNGNYNLNVGGTLVADGTEAEPILFTGHTGNAWGRIHFDDPSGDAQTTLEGAYEGGNILRYTRIEGASTGIGCTNATPYLEHVTLTGGGMNCAGGDTALWIKDSDLTGNVQITEGSGVDSLYGGWVVLAPMPTPRFGLRATTAPNGLIYAIGGADASWNYYSSVEVYDPSTNTWRTRSPMPTARGFLGVVTAANGKIYAIGGNNGVNNDGSMGTVEEYDPTTDTWTTRTPMPTSRREFALVAADNGRIYAIGGLSDQVQLLNVVEEYDPWTDSWTARAPMPTARMALSAVSANNGRLYAIGGHIPPHNVALVEEYDPTTDTWTGRTPMPTVRGSMGLATALNGRIYSMGGYGSTTTNRVDEYDPEQDVWSIQPLSPMSIARSNLGVARSADGYIYTIGGMAGDVTAIMEKFSPPEPGAEHNGYNIIDTTIHGALHVPRRCQVQACVISGDISSNDYSVIRDTDAGSIAAGNGSTIQNNMTRGSIIVNGSGTIRGNNTVSGGIFISGGSVLTNTVQGGEISVGPDSEVRGNDVEESSGWAISGGPATITRNRIAGSANGIQASGGLIQGNLIANITGTGLEIGSATVVSNTFTGIGGSAIKIASGAPGRIAGNNFEFNTGTYDVENLILATSLPTIDARNNWWGTTEGNVIQTRILDYSDDYTLGTVLFTPALAAPATDAPAYVRSVTLTPESPVGIQTVTFDMEFSREMDTTIVPSLAFANEEGWVSQSPMPTARRQFEAVTIPDGRIYAVGGYGGSFLATVEEYDPVAGTWRTRQSMPTARVDPAVAVTPNGRILVIGGNLNGVMLNTTEEYDPATNTWRTLSPMPTARQDAGAVTAPNGLIYVIGGFTGDWNHLSNVEVYDPTMDTWQTRSPMPTARGSLGVVLGHNGRIYAIGGNNGVNNEGSMGTVEEYDPATDTWRTRATMPTSRRCLATVASSNGRIYAVGGLSAQVELLDTLEEYDPVANTWRQLTPLSFPRMAFAAAPAVDSTSFYVIGGYVITDNLATVEKYTPPMSDPELHDVSWSQSNHYRSSSDITALIPRGVYHLTVSDAAGTDGIEIAPNSSFTFTIDYIGSPETTHPSAPVVRACASLTTTTLSAQWTVPTAQAIGLYRYAIGTAPGRSDVTNWITTTLTSVTRTNLNLLPGQAYYFSARARNTGGIWSDIGASNSVIAGADGCPQVDFTAMPTSGMAPMPVAFAPQITGTVTSYIWSYGNNITGTQASPVYTYTLPGTYTVTLEVFGPGGWARVAKEAFISVVPDTIPPSGTLAIAGGAAHIATTTVTLTIAASDPSGLDGMRFSNNGTSFSPWVPYNQTYAWTLASGDGPKTVYVQVRDVPGNIDTFTSTIILDTAPPTAAVAALPAFTGGAIFTVAWAGSDLYAGVADFDLQVREGAEGIWTDWLTHTTMTSAPFTGTHGATYYFRAIARDTLGNLGQYAAGNGDTHITIDLVPPVGSVLMNDGAMYTNDLSVRLNLSATDLSGVEAFQLSNDGLAYSEWVSYTTVYSWTLTAGDGTKTVYARFRDMVGHASEVVTDTIVLHTEPPTGLALIADDIWATASPSVTLSITATDSLGVADMCIANDAEPCTDWEPFVTWREWLLQPVDGARTVTVQVRDLAGVTTVLTDGILLDTTPPTAVVDSLPPFQTVLTFSVSWSGSDLTEIANFDIQVRQGDQPWSDWLTSTTALSATFTGLDGHTYYFRARARDVLGNLGVYAPDNGDTSTHVDSRRPEGSISINGGAIDTTSQNVVLLLTTNDATEMAFSDDGMNFSAWEPFATTRLYVLASGDGLKTVSVRFRNVVGNISEYNDSITLNAAISGDVGVSINNDDPVTEQITVTLTIKAPPNTQYMMVSNSSRFATAEWEPYAATRTWVLAYHPYVTVYPVYVRYRNVDGTVSANYDDIITLHLLEPPPPVDSVPPAGSMVINAGTEETAIQDVLLDVLAADNPGGMGVQWVYLREWKYDPVAVQWVIVRNSGWLPYTENSIAWTLAPGTGVKYIGAWFADGANNVSNPVVIDSINLVLPGDTIGEAQVTQYRRTFEPGQRISMTLTVNSGDADLYIWLPESIAAPDYWSNLPGTATERLVFTAIEGEYLVEVHGYASSMFTLDIATDGGGGGNLGQAPATTEQPVSGLAALASKPLPPRPLVITRPGDPVPDESPRQYIYLPLVVRGHK